MAVAPELDLDHLLKIFEIVSILGGGGLVAFKLGRTTSTVESALKVQEEGLKMQAEQVSELKHEVKKMGDVLTSIAVQGSRIDRLEGDVRDMRHGRGFVQEALTGEYLGSGKRGTHGG